MCPSILVWPYECAHPATEPSGLSVPSGIVAGMNATTTPSGRLPQTSLTDVLKRQHQVISRNQVLAAGITSDTLSRRVSKGGPWQRLLPGVYLAVAGSPTQDQREAAALLYAGTRSTVSGIAALRRHGQRTPSCNSVDVLVPATRRRQSAGYVVVHRTTQVPERVCYQGSLQYTLPSRAVADAVRWLDDLGTVRGLVAGAVQTKLCSIEQLISELRTGPMQGSAHFRTVLAEVIDGIRSPAEAEARELIRRSGLPAPMFNARLFVGDMLLAIPDAWWPDFGVAVEVDSQEWHLLPEDWKQTMSRHDKMTALGILVLHFTPQQIREEPEHVVSTIRQALLTRRGQPRLPIRAVAAAG